MEKIFKILLILHITGGIIGLITGSIIMAAKKGDKRHKLLGKIFSIAMLIAAISSLIMAYLHPNYFLFIIGIWTTYMILTGNRALAFKQKEITFGWQDYTVSGIMLLFATGFISFGIINLIGGFEFGIVFLVFGGLSLLMVFQDYKNFKGQTKFKNNWLMVHLQRMIGAYIASATAFMVVNNKWLPSVVAWLLPGAILVPFIFKWVRKYGILKKT
jgi:uncharacterized membrane protein